MTNENMKKIAERPLQIFVITFLSFLALWDPKGFSSSIGTYFLFGGSIVAAVGFGFINKGKLLRTDGYERSQYARSDDYFKKVRAEEKPFERIVWPIIFASVLVATIGYLTNEILFG